MDDPSTSKDVSMDTDNRSPDTKRPSLQEAQQSKEMVGDVNEGKLQDVRQKLKCVLSPQDYQYAIHLLQKTSVTQSEVLELCTVLLDRHPKKGGKNIQQSPQSAESRDGKKQKSTYSPWFQPTVRVCAVVTGRTFGADEAILEQVKNNSKGWTSPEVQITGLQECDIIMVLCPITARIGSDVEAAIKREEVSQSDKPLILVLMHHTWDVEYSAGRRKWAEKNSKIVLEVHVLFHETQPGLLQCERNLQAVGEICNKLHKHSKYGWSRNNT